MKYKVGDKIKLSTGYEFNPQVYIGTVVKEPTKKNNLYLIEFKADERGTQRIYLTAEQIQPLNVMTYMKRLKKSQTD